MRNSSFFKRYYYNEDYGDLSNRIEIQLPAEDSDFAVEKREEAHAQSIVASDQSTTQPADQIENQSTETIAARDQDSDSCSPENKIVCLNLHP